MCCASSIVTGASGPAVHSVGYKPPRSGSEKEPQQKVVKTIKLVEAEDTYGGNSLTASSPKWSKTWPQHLSAFLEAVTEAAPAIDNWEEVTPDPAISYVDFISVDEDVAVCGEVTDAGGVAEVLNDKIQAETI
uniref:Uncharacterized protein n=1 Tax=Timema monikensis TaxID=170555 RepID=A0A7R9E7D8_9NEOP|nr:unnamed protein product [Timema monikensis]